MLVVASPSSIERAVILRAMLARLDANTRNVISVETSVDYEFPGVNQSELSMLDSVSLTEDARLFPELDADVIAVDDVRNPAVAKAGLEAALSGSLALLGLRARSVCQAVALLLDMDLDEYALADVLKVVVAQRTVRAVCQGCSREIQPASDVLEKLGFSPGQFSFPLYAGQGCSRCFQTRLAGTVRLFEVLWLDREILNLIRRRADMLLIQQTAERMGMQTIRQSAVEKLKAGLISPDEMAGLLSL